ncbi:MAG TPA: hypothetical protein VFD39_04630, partial [Trueperaceae bacterium]|nr:hypothetical protein [Trueperaceae bacterium]
MSDELFTTTSRRSPLHIGLALLLTVALSVGAIAFSHQSITVGDGAYRIVVGLLDTPLYAGEIEGIDLAVFDADDEPVENLQGSLLAVVVAPTGQELTL